MKQPLTGTLRAIRMISEADASRVNASDRHMLLTMLRWADTETLELRPAVETIARAMGAHPQTVRRRLKRLEDMGVLVFLHRSEGGRCDTHRMKINLSALTVEEPMLLDVLGPATGFEGQASITDSPTETPARRTGNPRASSAKPLRRVAETPAPCFVNPCAAQGEQTTEQTKEQPPPPRGRGSVPDFAPAAGGGRGGGRVQCDGTKATPVATTVRRVAEVEANPTHEANQAGRPATVATNAAGASPVVEALVALTVPRAEAEELAALPHTDLVLVAYVAAAAERQKPNRPARWIASLVRRGPKHLEGWDQHLAKQRDRERRHASALIRHAADWALQHASDEVYRPFIANVSAAIKPHFPRWGDAIRDGSLHPSVIRADATPVEVLASLASSCGVEIEIPTDTLRMPERDTRTPSRDGASHAS